MTVAPVVVADTSVHVSSEAFSKGGSPSREVIARGFAAKFTFASSEKLVGEIARKFAEFGINPILTAEYLGNLRASSASFADVDDPTVSCADPEDTYVMILAKTATAWCIVSQDNALLDDEGSPPGWAPPPFLRRFRERREEPPGTRFP
jgi:predicted nucleic acid-binding protein